MSQVHPRHPRQLPRSKWTSLRPDEHGFRHWEVEAVTRTGEVILRATLDGQAMLRFAWRQLRDRDIWSPGWHTGPAQE